MKQEIADLKVVQQANEAAQIEKDAQQSEREARHADELDELRTQASALLAGPTPSGVSNAVTEDHLQDALHDAINQEDQLNQQRLENFGRQAEAGINAAINAANQADAAAQRILKEEEELAAKEVEMETAMQAKLEVNSQNELYLKNEIDRIKEQLEALQASGIRSDSGTSVPAITDDAKLQRYFPGIHMVYKPDFTFLNKVSAVMSDYVISGSTDKGKLRKLRLIQAYFWSNSFAHSNGD